LAVFQYRRAVYDPTFALLGQVRYADAEGKVAAIRTLLENRATDPAVLETLLGALADADPAVRAVAARGVADVAFERSDVARQKHQDDSYAGDVKAALTAAMKDRDPSVRLRAASGLVLLSVNSEEVFATLLRAARPDGKPDGRFLPGGEPDDRLSALHNLANSYRDRPETQAAILDAIADRDPRSRKHGVIALNWYLRGWSRAVPEPIAEALFTCLDDQHELIDNTAAHALSRLGPTIAPRAVPLLIGKLTSPNLSTREWAAHALGEFNLFADEALPALRALAGNPGKGGRDQAAARKAIEAITAASRTFQEQTLPNLVANLSHDDPDVRAGAASALAEQGPRAKAAIPDLTRALKDPELKVRRRASAALEAIGAARR
jgi:HEAT repeat protein